MVATKLLPLLFVLLSVHASQLTLRQHAKPLSPSHSPALKQVNPSCLRYMCAPANLTLAPNACIHYENSTYYLHSCANNTDGTTFCSTDLNDNNDDNFCQVPPAEPNGLAWAGERCVSNSSCLTNYCSESSKLCVGAGQGEDCSSNVDCGAGLFCTGGQCTPLQGLGKVCATDFDCANYLGCNRTSLFYGTCMQYFSVPIGAHVSDCDADSTSYLCASGSCLLQSFNGAGVCIKPIVSVKTPPQSCQSDQDCVGTSGSQAFQSSCQCGYNPTGTAYCAPFLGDSSGHDYLYYMSRLISMNVTQQCNTVRRFDYGCINSLPITWGKTVIAFSILYQYYTELQGNDNCVKAVYTAYYWKYSFGGVLLVSAAAIGLF